MPPSLRHKSQIIEVDVPVVGGGSASVFAGIADDEASASIVDL